MMWQPSLQQDGFALLPGIFAADEMSQLAQAVSAAAVPQGRAGIRHALRFAAVAAIAADARLLDLAKEGLGSDAVPFRATLFDKSPQANWLVAWHQDTALPVRVRRETPGWGPWSLKDGVTYAHAPASALERVVALRLHLDDSTDANGPLRVLPGTHTLGVLGDDAIHERSTVVQAVDCLVPKGGVLAMRPLVIHASWKSRTPSTRRVLHIEYAASFVFEEGLELAVA